MVSYSFSRIKSFYNCKLYYYLHYFDKSLPEVSHGTSEFGSFIHEILEMYAKGKLEIYEMLPYYEEHYNDYVISDFTLKMSSIIIATLPIMCVYPFLQKYFMTGLVLGGVKE